MSTLALGSWATSNGSIGQTLLLAVVIVIVLCPIGYASYLRAKHLTTSRYSHHVGAAIYGLLAIGVACALMLRHGDLQTVLVASVLGAYFLALSITHFKQIQRTRNAVEEK